MIACLDQFLQAGLLQTQILQEHGLLILLQLGDLLLDLGADDKHLTALARCILPHLLYIGVACTVVRQIILGNVGRVDHRLVGQQIIGSDPCLLILIVHLQASCQLAILQMGFDPLQESHFLGQLLVILGASGRFCDPALQDLHVREDQLEVDGLNVPQRVHTAVHMHHIAVLKAAHHMNDGVYLTNIGQELVAQALALGRALYQTGDVHKLNGGRCHLLGMIHVAQQTETLIRHCHDTDVRVDGTERIVGRLRTRLGQRVEKCTFADIRQTDDS